MVSVTLPLQFTREYAGPIDADSVFTTTALRNTYLTNPRRYPGMIVSDLQDGNAYQLNAGGNAWVAIAGGSSAVIQTVSMPLASGAEQILAVLATTMIDTIVFLPGADTVNMSIGSAAGLHDIMPQTQVLAAKGYSFGYGRYFIGNTNLYINGITSDLTLKIYKR